MNLTSCVILPASLFYRNPQRALSNTLENHWQCNEGKVTSNQPELKRWDKGKCLHINCLGLLIAVQSSDKSKLNIQMKIDNNTAVAYLYKLSEGLMGDYKAGYLTKCGAAKYTHHSPAPSRAQHTITDAKLHSQTNNKTDEAVHWKRNWLWLSNLATSVGSQIHPQIHPQIRCWNIKWSTETTHWCSHS